MVAVSATQVAAGGPFVANATGVIAVIAKVTAKVIVKANNIASVSCFFLCVWTDVFSLLLGFITFYKVHAYLKDFSYQLFNNNKYFFGLFRYNYKKFMYKMYPESREGCELANVF
jgi:hypothetical protein